MQRYSNVIRCKQGFNEIRSQVERLVGSSANHELLFRLTDSDSAVLLRTHQKNQNNPPKQWMNCTQHVMQLAGRLRHRAQKFTISVSVSTPSSDHGSENSTLRGYVERLLSSTRTHSLDTEPQANKRTRFHRHLVAGEKSIKEGRARR